MAKGLIEDVAVLKHFTISLTNHYYEKMGCELTLESRISETVTHSLLSHLRNEAIKHGFHFVKLLADDLRFVVKRKTGF